MKRFVFKFTSLFGKVALLLSTLVVGIALTILLSEVSPPTVSLCQLAQYPSWYDGRTIRIEAGARSIYGWIIIEDETCRLPEAWAGVSLLESNQASGETRRLFTESGSENYKARVLVTGRFNANASMGCFGPKFGIDATSVELKSPITTELRQKRAQE